MSALGQPAQHIFGPDNGEGERLGGAVDRGDEEQTARPDHVGASGEEEVDVRDMFDDLQREHDVEALALGRDRLGGRRAIVDIEPAFGGMELGDFDIGLGGVRRRDIEAEPAHRFRDQATAAADVEKGQAGKGFRLVELPVEIHRHLLADRVEANRIELVQRLELALRVPPFGGEPREPLDFVPVDRAGAFGGRHRGKLLAPLFPMSPAVRTIRAPGKAPKGHVSSARARRLVLPWPRMPQGRERRAIGSTSSTCAGSNAVRDIVKPSRLG